MAHVAYIRVSSVDQNPGRQLEHLKDLDKVFTEKQSGASTRNRPVWQACRDYLREGDTLHVHSMDRLARSLFDLKKIVDDLTGQDITIKFHKENLTFAPGKTDPLSDLLFHVIGAVAQFERELIRERQREGIERAKKKGKKWGRRPALSDEQKVAVRNMAADGYSAVRIGREFGVSRQTVYRALSKN